MKYVFWTFLATLASWDCQSQDLLPFRMGTLWGYRDEQGVVKIEPQFQYASKFKYDVAVVAKNDSLGAISKDNHVIIPFRYEFLRVLDTSEFLFGYRAKYFGEHIMGVMTKDEKIKIRAAFSSISKYNGIYTVDKKIDSTIGKSAIGDVRSIKNFYGLLDSNGKVLIPCMYDDLSWINDSLLVVDSLVSLQTGFKQSNYALFNKKGEQLTKFEYMVIGKFVEGIAGARIGNSCVYIYPNGKVVIPVQFDACEEFNQDYAIIKQNEKWGAISKDGKIIIKPEFAYEEVKRTLKEEYSR